MSDDAAGDGMSDAGNGAPVDAALVRELAEILRDTDLAEIEVESEAIRIRLSRAPAALPAMAPAPAAPATPPAPASEASPAPAAPAAPASRNVVPSPMVGTAYLSPSPGAAAFVAVGQSVREGETLMIIEAMKVMNQIPAPRDGTVREVLCEDGQPVEFDQPLMVID